jgi:[histone H3]-lysine79 N-trimethyltransferase
VNECIRPKFLDLKEGAIVVALKPFVPVNARLTERNVGGFTKENISAGGLIGCVIQIDDISAIFEVTQKEYNSGSVSWGSGRGYYYIHRVDREGYVKIRQKLESGRPIRSRR